MINMFPGQTKYQERVVSRSIVEGETRTIDKDISAGTVSAPVDLLFVKAFGRKISMNFKSDKPANVLVRVSDDITANLDEANNLIGDFASNLISPPTIVINLTGIYEDDSGTWRAVHVQAYPDTANSGTTLISAHCSTRSAL